MKRDKIVMIESTAVPLEIENVDTDQIIPARFLKATSREGFGENLFRDWRYNKENKPIENFVLNNKEFDGKILVASKNFGSGSSREHAAWALYDYGFRVVVSSFFADIFKNNALNNGILPIQVSDELLGVLFSSIHKNSKAMISVDLPSQVISLPSQGLSESFDISSYKKECLINGVDDIDYLLGLKDEIAEFQGGRQVWL